MQGDVPPVEIALELYSILSESDTNLRQPVGLENQLMKNSMGSEVGQSILQLLQVTTPLLSCCCSEKQITNLLAAGSASHFDM